MSLVPFLLDELMEMSRRETVTELYDQKFGLGLFRNDLLHPKPSLLSVPAGSGYIRTWRTMGAGDSGVSNVHITMDGFKVHLDVQQFRPEELKAKIVNEFLVIEGSHGEREDEHGFISRQFVRRYKLPQNVDVLHVSSTLSSDGVLSLEAPIRVSCESCTREIPIQQTNVPIVDNKENLEVEPDDLNHMGGI